MRDGTLVSECRAQRDSTIRSGSDRQRGSNVLEMALVLPFLLLLVVGIVELGGALNNLIVISNASREGARYGARIPFDESGIQAAAIQEAASLGVFLTTGNIAISPDPTNAPAEQGQTITVTVSYSYDTLMGAFIGLDEIPLNTTTRMIVFGAPEAGP